MCFQMYCIKQVTQIMIKIIMLVIGILQFNIIVSLYGTRRSLTATNIELEIFYYVTRLINYIRHGRCKNCTSVYSSQHSIVAHEIHSRLIIVLGMSQRIK